MSPQADTMSAAPIEVAEKAVQQIPPHIQYEFAQRILRKLERTS
jgi:hypothetical protein